MAKKEAYVQYIKDLSKYEVEKPFNLSFSTYRQQLTTNVEKEEKCILIQDIRGQENQFSVEKHSFRFLKLPTQHPIDGTDDVTFRYLEETRNFLLQEFDADEVICYDIRRRRSDATDEPQRPDENYFGAMEDAAPPVYNVHVDHSLEGGFHRIKRHLTPEESERYLAEGWRIRIIKSVAAADLIETDQINESWYGEIFLLKFNPGHQFYWLSNQTPDEDREQLSCIDIGGLGIIMPTQESRPSKPTLSLNLEPPPAAKDTKTQPWKSFCQPQVINYTEDTRADFPNIRLQCHKDEHESTGG
ncbi:hypothetical protein TrVFT333_004366 [Trichoderma virens FT-333]|nr:hypothetical protein TrVFT333_004366 [Trichoderma virens FT-333]